MFVRLPVWDRSLPLSGLKHENGERDAENQAVWDRSLPLSGLKLSSDSPDVCTSASLGPVSTA